LVYNLVKDCNAAVARNVGEEKSSGDILFFVDGDMEIRKEFLSLVYTKKEGLCDDFVSGNWMNYNYDISDKLLNQEPFLDLKEDVVQTTTGGLFLIKRSLWQKLGGMRNMFKKSQDIDLGLRLAKKGIFLKRKKEFAANHHTIAYQNKNRIWKELITGKHLYGRSLLYREHIFNKHMYNRLLRNDYSFLLLLGISLAVIFSGFFQLFLIYLFVILIRSKFKLNIMVYYFLRDTIVMFGLFLFVPKRKFNVVVEKV